MRKTYLVLLLAAVIILLGLWLAALSHKEDLEPGVIREDSLDIKTDNPQPAGRNITY